MVTNTYKEAAYAQETDEIVIALLTFTSDELTQPIYISNVPYQLLPIANVRGVVSNSIEYIYLPIEITLPTDDDSGIVSAKLTIENIDRIMIASVRSVTKPITLKIDVILASNLNTPEITFNNFKLNNINYNSTTIEGDLSLDYWGLEPFPSFRFVPSLFPGLF